MLAGLAAIAASVGDQDRVMRLASDAEALASTITKRGAPSIQYRVLAYLVVIVGLLVTRIGQPACRQNGSYGPHRHRCPHEVDALVRLATATAGIGERDRAFHLIGEAEALGRSIIHPRTAIDVLAGLATAAAETGNRETAFRLSDTVVPLARRTWDDVTIRNLSITIAKAGDLDRAETLARTSGRDYVLQGLATDGRRRR